MDEEQNREPGIVALVGRMGRTALGALQNRFELLAVEWQEERIRLAQLLAWSVGLVFLGIMAVALFTVAIIFMCSEEHRAYAACAFAVLYFAAAIFVWLRVRSILKREPFAETMDQSRKDKEWLKSLE